MDTDSDFSDGDCNRDEGNDRAVLSLHLVDPAPISDAAAIELPLTGALAKVGRADVHFPAPGLYRLFVSKHTSIGKGVASASPSRPAAAPTPARKSRATTATPASAWS